VERLMFYVAGVPTYVVVGELALNVVLVGTLPRPDYPDALALAAQRRWHDDSLMTLNYARRAFGSTGDVVGTAAHVGRAVLEAAHGRLAARKEWVLNEKRLAERAGLAELGSVIGRLGTSPDELVRAVDVVDGALRT
jgi:hypothetical protein